MLNFNYSDSAVLGEFARFQNTILDELNEGVDDALDRFKTEYTVNHLQRRTPTSVGPRSRTLLEAFTTESDRKPGKVDGRIYFRGDEKLQTIARTLEEGATIRPKRGRFLRFRVHRRFHRAYKYGPWEGNAPYRDVYTEKVEIDPYLNFFDSVERFEPIAGRIIDAAADRAAAKLNARLA